MHQDVKNQRISKTHQASHGGRVLAVNFAFSRQQSSRVEPSRPLPAKTSPWTLRRVRPPGIPVADGDPIKSLCYAAATELGILPNKQCSPTLTRKNSHRDLIRTLPLCRLSHSCQSFISLLRSSLSSQVASILIIPKSDISHLMPLSGAKKNKPRTCGHIFVFRPTVVHVSTSKMTLFRNRITSVQMWYFST